MRLFLVRHGQTDLNRDDRFRGICEAPLNAEGRLQAAGAARILAREKPAYILTSPQLRAIETAEIIAEAALCGVEVVTGFRDVDYGGWQGLTVEEVGERYGPEVMSTWRNDPGGFAFPGGDGMPAVRERLCLALEGAAPAHGDTSVAIVSHLAVLKVCLLVLMDLSWEWFWRVSLENGSVSAFSRQDGSGFVLDWWNRPPLGA